MIATVKTARIITWIVAGKAAILGAGLLFLPGRVAGAPGFDGSIEIETRPTHSRLMVSLDSSFTPVFHDSEKGFRIEIPVATLMDIGVPFGAEAAFNQRLKELADERLAGIRVRELEGRLEITGEYRFPEGERAFAYPKMEHFDFRKDGQGRFLIDFFYRKGPTRIEVAREQRALKIRQEREKAELFRKKEEEKKVLREKRIADGRNALRFCEQPFNRETTVFLKFRPEHEAIDFHEYFSAKIPDHRFEYTEPKGKDEEAGMVRLALKLARENRHALAIRTVDFLEKEHPKSKHRTEMRFLKASAYFRLDQPEKGRALLRELAKSPDATEAGFQAAGFLAAADLWESRWLSAFDLLMRQKKIHPDHPLIWLVRYGIAESLYQIRQGDQAREELEWIAKNAPKPEIRARAAFQMGDVFLERGQYAQAVTGYTEALKGREALLPSYPAVLLNLAEAYFQLDEMDRARTTLQKFLEVGPSHIGAWRASIRLAELSAMTDGLNEKTEKDFMETINRYPLSPGSLVARIRLLPCGSHGGFDLPSADRLLYSPEVLDFPADGAIRSNQFRELVGLTEVRMLISFGEHQKAIDRGLLRLRANPGIETRKLIEQAMIGAIKMILEKKLDAADHFGAIAFYEKFGDFLPLPAHDPLVDELKMRLATVSAQKGLTRFALKLIEPYRMMNEASRKEVIAAIEKHVTLEGQDDQEERNLVEAKTLWNGADFKVEEQGPSDQLVARLGAIRDESKQGFEKNLILALFYREKKEFGKALEHAKRLEKGIIALKPREKAQIRAFAGDVAGEAKDADFAAKSWREARIALAQATAEDRGELPFRRLGPVPTMAFLVQSEGEALEKGQKWKEAVALYSEAVDNKIGGNLLLYSHAKAVLRAGGKDSKAVAAASLKKIEQSQEDDVWKRLARETLNEIAKEGDVDGQRNP